MRFFSKLYSKIMALSSHRHASFYLAGISFAESSFFPLPPDVMLVPMTLSKPEKAWWYAIVTSLASALGGVLGYVIGMFFFELVRPWLVHFGYLHMYQQVVEWFKLWGIWVVLMAGFTPVPYKLITISSGVVGMPIIPFVAASFIGRGVRFFLVAGLTLWGGDRVERLVKKYRNPA